jgi:ABC-type multidrug transport system ATPase subunit
MLWSSWVRTFFLLLFFFFACFVCFIIVHKFFHRPNGAGKTTLLETLSGLSVPQRGKVLVAGVNIATGLRTVLGNIGVCPQFDVVWGELTVKDHLLLYARLKGVPGAQQMAAATLAAAKVELDGDAFGLKARELSGGMRRRLSIAAALVGEPKVLILDEPTTGLDPDTRRQIWEIVNKEKRVDRAIILTTHSMEEADTLCTRIGIMASGRLRALGTTQHLKGVYGTGFRLTLTLSPNAPAPDVFVQSFCQNSCRQPTVITSEDTSGGCSLDDQDHGVESSLLFKAVGMQMGTTVMYTLPRDCFDPVEALSALHRNAKSHGIREWSLEQPSLEEVFVNVARRYSRD